MYVIRFRGNGVLGVGVDSLSHITYPIIEEIFVLFAYNIVRDEKHPIIIKKLMQGINAYWQINSLKVSIWL